MPELAIINSLWIGGRLSTMEQLSMLSFLKNGHPYHLYIYEEVHDIPDGVVLRDASQVLPRNRIFKYNNYDSYAGFANLFRYKLLFEKGSYWADTDVVCVKPFDFTSDYVFATQRKPDRTFQCASCVIRSPVGSEIMRYCYEMSDQQDPKTLKWGQTGPILLTKAVNRFDMLDYMVPYTTFCPVPHWRWRDVTSASPLVRLRLAINMKLGNACTIHFWNEMWRRNNLDKEAVYPSNCLYERLQRRYSSKKLHLCFKQ